MADTVDRPARKPRKPRHATVARTERLTPHMIRVVLAVDPADRPEIGEYTDHYVKLVFAPEGVVYPEPWTSKRSAATCRASSGRGPVRTRYGPGTRRPGS